MELTRFQISKEVRLGEVLVVIGFVGSAAGFYASFNADLALLKQGQVSQAETNKELKDSIREVRQDVKELSRTLRHDDTGARMRGG